MTAKKTTPRRRRAAAPSQELNKALETLGSLEPTVEVVSVPPDGLHVVVSAPEAPQAIDDAMQLVLAGLEAQETETAPAAISPEMLEGRTPGEVALLCMLHDRVGPETARAVRDKMETQVQTDSRVREWVAGVARVVLSEERQVKYAHSARGMFGCSP